MKKSIILGTGALLTLGVLALGGSALARPPGGPGFGGAMPMMHLIHELDLTEQQEVKAVHLRRTMMEEGKQAHEEVRATVSAALPELEKQNPDSRKLHATLDQVIQRMSKVAHSALDKYLELHATFTPEQRKVLVEKAKQMQEHANDRMDDEHGPREKGRERRWE